MIREEAARAAVEADAWRQCCSKLRPLLEEMASREPVAWGFDPANRDAEVSAVMEAARWRGEAKSFYTEVRRVEAAQRKLQEQRSAEEAGWSDFRTQVQAQLREKMRLTAEAQASSWRLAQQIEQLQHRQTLQGSADACNGGRSSASGSADAEQLAVVKQALREARERRRRGNLEVEASAKDIEGLQAEMLEMTNRCAVLQQTLRKLSGEV